MGIYSKIAKRAMCAAMVVSLSLGHTAAWGSKMTEAKTVGKKQFTLSAAGDVTLSSDIKQPASVNFFQMYNKQTPDYFFKKVKKVFEKDDLTLVNFEGTLSNRGSREDKQWAFRGKPSYIKILKKGSVEAVSFSNNHTRDYGEISRKDTIKTLKKANIAFSTEYKSTIKKVNGIRVGLISISSIGYPNAVNQLKKQMKRIKKKKPDVIIMSMHSGIEHTQTIADIQVKLSHTAIDMGADLVIGHHPHVIQKISKYKGSYILYSTGNFCFGGNTNPSDKDTFIFQQTFVVKNGKLISKKNAKVIPCRLSGKDNINNYQPVVCKGAAKKRIISRLNNYSDNVRINSKGMLKKVKKK